MEEKIKEIVYKACKKLYKEDYYLIEKNVHERAIVFRLGIYMQRLLSRSKVLREYNLDVEYNRNGDDLKRLPKNQDGTYPDVILHKRGKNGYKNNIVIIECKKGENPNLKNDFSKIRQFIDKDGEYKYLYGMSLQFIEDKVVMYFFERQNKEKSTFIMKRK